MGWHGNHDAVRGDSKDRRYGLNMYLPNIKEEKRDTFALHTFNELTTAFMEDKDLRSPFWFNRKSPIDQIPCS